MYAFLAEALSSDDRFSAPLFLSVGVKPRDVDAMSKRDDLDVWLAAPSGDQALSEKALVKFLQS